MRWLLASILFVVMVNCGNTDKEGGFGSGAVPAEPDPDGAVIADGSGGDDSDDTGMASDGDGGRADTGAPSDVDADGTSLDGLDADADADADGGSSMEDFGVTGFTVSECSDGESDPSMRIQYDETVGHVRVHHDAHWANCCADFSLTATGSPDGEVSILYDEGDDECDCMCGYDLVYNLVGLPTGNWTIRIPDGLTGEITIP